MSWIEGFGKKRKNIFDNSSSLTPFVWKSMAPLVPQGCDKDGKFAFMVHGFQGSKSAWQSRLVEKLRTYRGGCIIRVDWGAFSDILNYIEIVQIHWPKISALITKSLKQLQSEGVLPENIYMYGHSLGARLVIDAAINFGKRKIGLVDGKLC